MSMDKGDMLFGIAMLFVMQIVCFAVGMITPAAMRIKDGDKGKMCIRDRLCTDTASGKSQLLPYLPP